MGKPYSSDLRQRFVAALDDGMSASAAGRRMRIARATAVRWAATWQREGRAEALPMGGDRRSGALETHASKILGWLADKPDLFLGEIVTRLAEEDVKSSVSSVARLLTRHGITHKKRPSLLRSRRARISQAPAPNGVRG
jgi:transposase